MFKSIAVILLLAVSSYAIEFPINKKYYIKIENGEFTVFQFPFKIKKTFSSGFLISKDSKEIKKLEEEDKKNILTSDISKLKAPKPNKIIQIKQGNSSLTFLPKAAGTFNIVVWGYKKYPLMFDITVVNSKDKKKDNIDNYYKFIDYSENKKKAKEFESTSHEKVIVKLMRSIYNKKLPSGYKNKTTAQTFEDNSFAYIKNISYVGNRYTAEEWYIKNKTNKKISLYEEEFLVDGVYAIAFENNLLYPKTQTRMFIVKKTQN